MPLNTSGNLAGVYAWIRAGTRICSSDKGTSTNQVAGADVTDRRSYGYAGEFFHFWFKATL